MKAAIDAMIETGFNFIIKATEKASTYNGYQSTLEVPSFLGSAGPSEAMADQIDLLSRVQFDIVDTPNTAGRGGANKGISADGLMHIEISAETFLQYYRLDKNPMSNDGLETAEYSGLSHIFAHEWAHQTDAGSNVNQLMYDLYLNQPGVSSLNESDRIRGYDLGNSYFETNEKYTNTFAAELLKSYSLDGLVSPPGLCLQDYFF